MIDVIVPTMIATCFVIQAITRVVATQEHFQGLKFKILTRRGTGKDRAEKLAVEGAPEIV